MDRRLLACIHISSLDTQYVCMCICWVTNTHKKPAPIRHTPRTLCLQPGLTWTCSVIALKNPITFSSRGTDKQTASSNLIKKLKKNINNITCVKCKGRVSPARTRHALSFRLYIYFIYFYMIVWLALNAEMHEKCLFHLKLLFSMRIQTAQAPDDVAVTS